MHTPYEEYYQQEILSKQELTWQQVRQRSTYPLRYAKASLVTLKNDATLLRQHLNYKPFHMNLYEIDSNKAIAWLSENYWLPHLSNAFLENQFHTTEESLYAQFKSEFYSTPHEYVTYLRITKAQFLINERNEPIADVYMEVGYEDEKKFQADYQKYFLKVKSKQLLYW